MKGGYGACTQRAAALYKIKKRVHLGLVATDKRAQAMSGKMFRCPFETLGRRENTIVDVDLSEGAEERFESILSALRVLNGDSTKSALCFKLPRASIQGCTSNEELYPRVMPYLGEILALDVEAYLTPLMPYQDTGSKVPITTRVEWVKAVTAQHLWQIARFTPQSREEWVAWINKRLQKAQANSGKPILEVHTRRRFWHRKSYFLRMRAGAVGYYQHVEAASNSKFTIVRTPFYPKTFGRWSPQVEIVVSRDTDFLKVAPEERRRIQQAAQAAHAEYGVADEDGQPQGFWLPTYHKSPR